MLHFLVFLLFNSFFILHTCGNSNKNKDSCKKKSSTKGSSVGNSELAKKTTLPGKAGSVLGTETGATTKTSIDGKEKNANLKSKENNNQNDPNKAPSNEKLNKIDGDNLQNSKLMPLDDATTKNGNINTFKKIIDTPQSIFNGPPTTKDNEVASKFMV
uniref:Uncharacterized protein n=1 Tax=Strongyloides stercoralis TaxID=6248 RepID=A0A0K0EA23_STRER